jgi:hypothetical protein
MKKPVFIFVLLLSLIFASAVFAQEYISSLSFQIINLDTYEVITSGTLPVSGSPTANLQQARGRIRIQLGFPSNWDDRTVNGVRQRIIWL